jgi:mRNA interferase MazF
MIKDFKQWHLLKTHLNERYDAPTFQSRDIWWCSIGVNIGHEMDGKNDFFNRPVLVLRKFNQHIFLGIPLTTKVKENPYYIKITVHGREQCAMISQLRTYESKRLTRRLARLDDGDFNKIREAVKSMI